MQITIYSLAFLYNFTLIRTVWFIVTKPNTNRVMFTDFNNFVVTPESVFYKHYFKVDALHHLHFGK